MATIGEYIGRKKARATRARPVSKERAFHFRRVSAGYYISNREHSNGQHISLEKVHDGWLLRFIESGETSKHATRKGCLYALENGVEE